MPFKLTEGKRGEVLFLARNVVVNAILRFERFERFVFLVSPQSDSEGDDVDTEELENDSVSA